MKDSIKAMLGAIFSISLSRERYHPEIDVKFSLRQTIFLKSIEANAGSRYPTSSFLHDIAKSLHHQSTIHSSDSSCFLVTLPLLSAAMALWYEAP